MTDSSDLTAAPAKVPPSLADTFRPASRCGFLERRGARLRYACWNAPGTARGSIILQQGRGEFIEKYASEIVRELLDRGFTVYALDWLGQGLSDRPLADRNKGHIDDFAAYVADFHLFLERVVAPAAPRPLIALCHSMGGHIVLRHIVENGSAPLSAAVCVSPMMGLPRSPLIRRLVNALSPFGIRDREYMVATGPYDLRHRSFATNDVTSDERRYRFTDRWFEADPRLVLGGPTIGWLRQAFRSMDLLAAPGMLERLDLPLLVVGTSMDAVVDPNAHKLTVTRVQGARLVMIEGAKHEILMETDERRAQFWRAFDHFVRTFEAP